MTLISDLDDRTLVEQHRAGDPDAFRRIVSRHHRSLYSNALRRLGDPNAAEDAVQDAFLRAFRNIERFDGDYHLDAWLHRIVTNTCHDIGRRRGRDTRLFRRACAEVEADVPAADQALDAVPNGQINDALDALPESYREVLVLRFVDELSYADVAEQAGISQENARARVSRGRTMLKRLLTSTSALIVWAIAPLRRQTQLTGAEAEAANQTATQVHGIATIASSVPAPTQAFNQLSGIIAQAGPAIATATPAVTSTGPTLKAAVAVGIAATVAIPAGVAVDRAREKSVLPVPAEVRDESAAVAVDAPVTVERSTTADAAPMTSAPSVVGTASVGGSAMVAGTDVVVGAGADAVAGTGSAPSTSTPTSEPQPSAPAGTDEQAPAPAPAQASHPAPAEEEPPPAAPEAGSTGQISASVSVESAGQRLVLEGPMKLEVDGEVIEGQLAGHLAIVAGREDPDDSREVEASEFRLELEDGRQLLLTLEGTSTVTSEDDSERHALDLIFQLDGAAEFGLAGDGELRGMLLVSGRTGELDLAVPVAAESS